MSGEAKKRSNMDFVRRTTTHPYGYAQVGNSDLAFIRISKNASTFIADSLYLKKWERIDRLPDHRFLCALRDPGARFISSVGETISRIGVFSQKGDVAVDLRILRAVTELCNDFDGDIEGFLLGYVKIIERFGFFDAHHEPQHYFLIDAWELGLEVEFFNVTYADRVLAALASSYKVRAGRRNSSCEKIAKPQLNANYIYQWIVAELGEFSLLDGPRILQNRLNDLYGEDYALFTSAECLQSVLNVTCLQAELDDIVRR